jgi:hypothetical protein
MPDVAGRPKCTGHVKLKDGNGYLLRGDDGTVRTRPCGNWPIQGATVCRSHGGGAPQVQEAAARQHAQQEIDNQVQGTLARLLDRGAVIENPLAELSRLATEAVLWKQIMAEQVAALRTYRFTDDRGGEQLHSAVALFERAMDRCNTILVGIAKLNIDERLAAINELQAQRVMAALDAGLQFASVPAEQLTATRLYMADYLQSVS